MVQLLPHAVQDPADRGEDRLDGGRAGPRGPGPGGLRRLVGHLGGVPCQLLAGLLQIPRGDRDLRHALGGLYPVLGARRLVQQGLEQGRGDILHPVDHLPDRAHGLAHGLLHAGAGALHLLHRGIERRIAFGLGPLRHRPQGVDVLLRGRHLVLRGGEALLDLGARALVEGVEIHLLALLRREPAVIRGVAQQHVGQHVGFLVQRGLVEVAAVETGEEVVGALVERFVVDPEDLDDVAVGVAPDLGDDLLQAGLRVDELHVVLGAVQLVQGRDPGLGLVPARGDLRLQVGGGAHLRVRHGIAGVMHLPDLVQGLDPVLQRGDGGFQLRPGLRYLVAGGKLGARIGGKGLVLRQALLELAPDFRAMGLEGIDKALFVGRFFLRRHNEPQ